MTSFDAGKLGGGAGGGEIGCTRGLLSKVETLKFPANWPHCSSSLCICALSET